eukprot:scaffold67720_cov36-Prasinocladus_malaysianus.AAC.1
MFCSFRDARPYYQDDHVASWESLEDLGPVAYAPGAVFYPVETREHAAMVAPAEGCSRNTQVKAFASDPHKATACKLQKGYN